MAKTIFTQKLCRTCGKKFRPEHGGAEVKCPKCKSKKKKPSRSPRKAVTKMKCAESGAEFQQKNSSRDKTCSPKCSDAYGKRQRKELMQAARDKKKPVKQPAPKPVKPVKLRIPEPSGDLVTGRIIGGDEFLRLKQLYEQRDLKQPAIAPYAATVGR